MSLVEHPGLKGQIWLSVQAGPVWFASVTEVFAFTMLDEDRGDLCDGFGRARNWEKPGPGVFALAQRQESQSGRKL